MGIYSIRPLDKKLQSRSNFLFFFLSPSRNKNNGNKKHARRSHVITDRDKVLLSSGRFSVIIYTVRAREPVTNPTDIRSRRDRRRRVQTERNGRVSHWTATVQRVRANNVRPVNNNNNG